MGLSHEFARVIIYLPVTRPGEYKAYTQILSYVARQRKNSRGLPAITGFTTTQNLPSPYIGYWWNTRKRPPRWDPEAIASIVIDYDARIGEQNGRYLLEKTLTELKDFCRDRYKAAGHSQQTFWITVQRIQLFN